MRQHFFFFLCITIAYIKATVDSDFINNAVLFVGVHSCQ